MKLTDPTMNRVGKPVLHFGWFVGSFPICSKGLTLVKLSDVSTPGGPGMVTKLSGRILLDSWFYSRDEHRPPCEHSNYSTVWEIQGSHSPPLRVVPDAFKGTGPHKPKKFSLVLNKFYHWGPRSILFPKLWTVGRNDTVMLEPSLHTQPGKKATCRFNPALSLLGRRVQDSVNSFSSLDCISHLYQWSMEMRVYVYYHVLRTAVRVGLQAVESGMTLQPPSQRLL